MAKTKPAAMTIVLVDDEPAILFGLTLMLRQAGFDNVHSIHESSKVLSALTEIEAGVVVLDLQMPDVSGKELLGEISALYPDLPVIILTAANDLDTAIDCMKKGAFDYQLKPTDPERFIATIRKALEMSSLRREVFLLRENLLSGNVRNEAAFAAIKTCNDRMKALFGYLEVVGPTEQPVLITGETGVGKELVARALHELSGRSGAFMAVNSAGLDDHMFADTLFGHKKGAFTGADQPREGMIVRAAGGTLFLDEIGDLSLTSQVKLLRLLQEGEFYPLGSDVAVKNRARIIVATNCGLEGMIAAGSFRKDLYYRLSAHKANVPPLRQRSEDILLLLETFIDEAAAVLQKKKPAFPPELLSYLRNYHFPGNVRELRAMVFDAVTRHQGRMLSMAAFREATGKECLPVTAGDCCADDEFLNLSGRFPTLKELEQSLITAAVRRSDGNQRVAAELLGISRQALNQRLSKK